MKCSACQLELVESPQAHYKSAMHQLNVQRQMYLIPPITLEEYMSEGQSSDCSLDISVHDNQYGQYTSNKKIAEKKETAKVKHEKCLFCDEPESVEHYGNHGLVSADVVRLQNKTCYICNEMFTNKLSLIQHLENGNHRTAVLDDNKVLLQNGKVIYNSRPATDSNISTYTRKNSQITHIQTTTNLIANNKNVVEKNKLKVSISMNSQKHFRPDWMQ